jgi:hypothetical protein
MMLTAALMALWVGTQATGAHAADGGRAQGNVTAERAGSGPYSLKFKASGDPNKATGEFTYREPSGYTVTGKVTCYYQEGNRAVMTGPVTKERNPDNDTEAFVVWVMDGSSSTGNPEGFDVAGTIISAAADCQDNFPLDRFDSQPPEYYIVTSGDIRVGRGA